jgi:hypothetical protein
VWKTGLLQFTDFPDRESAAAPAAIQSGLEFLQALGPLERAGVQFAATLVVAVVVLGLFQSHGTRTITKCRRSPVISGCIGLPATLVLGGLASGGYLLLETNLGMFLGVLLVPLGTATLTTLTALGFVAIGVSIATRLGQDRLWIGVAVGTLLSGVAALSVPVVLFVTAVAAVLGTGAGVRVVFGIGGTTSPDERTVPPANKI